MPGVLIYLMRNGYPSGPEARTTPIHLTMRLSVLLVALVLSGCDHASSTTPPDAVYTVRGQVEQVPAKDQPLAEFVVKHEPIDTFKNPNGTLGMDTMSMPFPPAPGLDVSRFAAGDIVEMDLAVWTTPGQRGYELRRVVKLPADTALRFGKAQIIPR